MIKISNSYRAFHHPSISISPHSASIITIQHCSLETSANEQRFMFISFSLSFPFLHRGDLHL
jgi:hypothetical protein